MSDERYVIDVDGFTAAVARLVQQFRIQNPGIGEFKCTCLDGTKVTIKVGKKDASFAVRTDVPKMGADRG